VAIDWPWLAATVVVAAAGLLAIYRRLRVHCQPSTAALVVALLAGATPLSRAVFPAVALADVALFSALGVWTFVSAASRLSPLTEAASTIGLAALIPLIAPSMPNTPTLFDSPSGFLALTPVVYVAVIGTIANARRRPVDLAAVGVALTVWPLSNTSLVPALAWLAPGLAVVIDWARRRPLVAAAPLVAGAIVWNYWLMVQYTAGLVPKDAPVSFAAMVRQQADVHTRAPYVYPFAFPGNVVSAWRAGIPLTRLDALSGEPRRPFFDMTFDRGADRFLLDGWGPSGSTSVGPFRPLAAQRASLVFPLERVQQDMDVGVVASTRGNASSATELEVFLNEQVIGRIHVAPSGASEGRLRVPAATVGRVLRSGYNRLSIVTSSAATAAIHRVRIAPSS
jgi:hypothetical protein